MARRDEKDEVSFVEERGGIQVDIRAIAVIVVGLVAWKYIDKQIIKK